MSNTTSVRRFSHARVSIIDNTSPPFLNAYRYCHLYEVTIKSRRAYLKTQIASSAQRPVWVWFCLF